MQYEQRVLVLVLGICIFDICQLHVLLPLAIVALLLTTTDSKTDQGVFVSGVSAGGPTHQGDVQEMDCLAVRHWQTSNWTPMEAGKGANWWIVVVANTTTGWFGGANMQFQTNSSLILSVAPQSFQDYYICTEYCHCIPAMEGYDAHFWSSWCLSRHYRNLNLTLI